MCIRDRDMVNDNNDKVDRVMALYKKLMNGGLIYKSEEAVSVSYTHLDVYKRQIQNCYRSEESQNR